MEVNKSAIAKTLRQGYHGFNPVIADSRMRLHVTGTRVGVISGIDLFNITAALKSNILESFPISIPRPGMTVTHDNNPIYLYSLMQTGHCTY